MTDKELTELIAHCKSGNVSDITFAPSVVQKMAEELLASRELLADKPKSHMFPEDKK